MLCAECQNLLSDYLDGDISDRNRMAIGEHLEACAPCETLRDDLSRLIEASANLPLHTPSPRVWEAIQREIGGANVVRGPQSWWEQLSARRFDFSVSAHQLLAAAAAVVVIAGAAWTLASPANRPSLGGGWTNLPAGSAPVAVTTLSHSQSHAEVDRFRATVDDMARRVEQRQTGWSPDLRETFTKTMTPVDTLVVERSQAYAADGTEATRGPLMDALREKLRILEEFARVK